MGHCCVGVPRLPEGLTWCLAAFRQQAVQRLRYQANICWGDPARVLLRRAGGWGLDIQLFLMGLNPSGLPPFYSEALKAWCLLCPTRVEGGLEPWAVDVGGADLAQPNDAAGLHPFGAPEEPGL